MTPNEWFWCSLSVLMVTLLPRQRGYRIFFALQFIQMMELPIVMHWTGFEPWHTILNVNIVMDLFVMWFGRHKFTYAVAALYTMDALKAFKEAPFDCDFQMIISPLSWIIFWLNNLIIVLLIVYSCRSRKLLAKGATCTINALNRSPMHMPMTSLSIRP